jgi:hypothetical protein
MKLRSDRRRTPALHMLLLFTCVALSFVIVAQQEVISSQTALIRLLSHDSSQLTALQVKQISGHH